MSLNDSMGSSSDGSQERSFWNRIWKFNDTCEGCNIGAEDSIHFFWNCSRAKEVWSALKLVFPAMLDQLCSFKDLLWCLMMDAKISLENIELLVTCVWMMWGNRNSVRYGGTRKEGSELLGTT